MEGTEAAKIRTENATSTSELSPCQVQNGVNGRDAIQEGKAVEIIRMNKHGKPECVLENMASVFLSEGHRNMATVSVNGTFRKGKSFLLNIFLNFLKNPDYRSWEGTIYEGFKSSGGLKPVTKGIQVWSKPFRSKDKDGEEVSIYLLDAEGLSATSSSSDNSIFTLSSLISSVQVHFFSSPLASNELDYFNFFVSFAKEYTKLVSEKPFQKFIMYFRNWIYPEEHEFGFEGGRDYMEKTFSDLKDVDLGDCITETFEEVKYFLMPHPGELFTKQNFDGQTKSISTEFLIFAEELSKEIFSPSNVKPKAFNGIVVTGKQFYEQLQDIVEWFRSGSQSGPTGLFSTLVEREAKRSMEHLKEHYLPTMSQHIKETDCLTSQTFRAIQTEVCNICLDRFRGEMRYKLESVCHKYEEILKLYFWNEYEYLEKERNKLEVQNLQSRNSIQSQLREMEESLFSAHTNWIEHRILMRTNLAETTTEVQNLRLKENWLWNLHLYNNIGLLASVVGAWIVILILAPFLAFVVGLIITTFTVSKNYLRKCNERQILKLVQNVLNSMINDTKFLKIMNNNLLEMVDQFSELKVLLKQKCSSIATPKEKCVLYSYQALKVINHLTNDMIAENNITKIKICEKSSNVAQSPQRSQDVMTAMDQPKVEFAEVPKAEVPKAKGKRDKALKAINAMKGSRQSIEFEPYNVTSYASVSREDKLNPFLKSAIHQFKMEFKKFQNLINELVTEL